MMDNCGVRKRIPLTQLRVGMYVTGMDCSWFRTPFLKHRFLVQSVEQIERLQRSNIHAVDIDPSRGLDVTSSPIEGETLHTIGLLSSTQAPPVQKAPPSGEMLAQELAVARDARDKLTQSVKTLFDEISKTGAQDRDRSTKPSRKSPSSREPSAPTPHSWH